jgi:hypothetical protein
MPRALPFLVGKHELQPGITRQAPSHLIVDHRPAFDLAEALLRGRRDERGVNHYGGSVRVAVRADRLGRQREQGVGQALLQQVLGGGVEVGAHLVGGSSGSRSATRRSAFVTAAP